jgi:glycosyltransferase involved in cell wall biosynthesis
MHIAILLSTYNGASYLAEQLDSFVKQSHSDWSLWASDDGSIDATIDIVQAFAKGLGGNRVHQIQGPKKGFAANFLGLVCNPNIKADAYAYSDQDDIWIIDKLERATRFLSSVPGNIPALYCSRTLYVDKNNRPIELSQRYTKPAVFANAMVQNIASGNTMVFNNAARSLLLKVDPNIGVNLHDWVTYILVTGAGGQVRFDLVPSVRYRQHSKNLIGMNIGIVAKMRRIQMLLQGRFRTWNNKHVAMLEKMHEQLTPENLSIFKKFAKARQLKGIERLVALRKSGVYRQSLSNNIAFFIAAMIGKV